MSELRRGGLGVYDLAGRVAVVAGGSGGIGAATALRLAEAGAIVVVGYHTGQQRAAGLVASLPGQEQGHSALRISVDDTPSIGAAAEAVSARHGHCDVLLNCAGWTAAVPHADLDALDDVTIDRVLAPQVRVLAVAPAAVDTGFVPGRGRDAIEKQAAGTPLRVVVHPDDVAVTIIGIVTHLRIATGPSSP